MIKFLLKDIVLAIEQGFKVFRIRKQEKRFNLEMRSGRLLK